jgi:hypothetical protein
MSALLQPTATPQNSLRIHICSVILKCTFRISNDRGVVASRDINDVNTSNEYGTDVKRIGINVQNAPHTTPAGFNFLIFVLLILYFLKKST